MTDTNKIEEGLENHPKPNAKEKEGLSTVDTSKDLDGSGADAHRPADNKGDKEGLEQPDTSKDLDGSGADAHRPADKVNSEPLQTIDAKESVEIDDSVEAKVVFEQETPSTELSEDIASMLESIDLPTEFKEKAKTLFEAAVSGRVADIKKQMFAINEAAMAEYKTALSTKLEAQIDEQLTFAISQWISENQVEVKAGIRTQLAESFMAGLYDLFESHYIEVPEGKEDVLESALEKVETLEAKLNEQAEANAQLTKELNESKKKVVLESLTKSLTDTQAERLGELVESIEFESVESYTEKVSTIVESISAVKPSEFLTEDVAGETNEKSESPVVEGEEIDPRIAAYANAIAGLN